MKRLDKAAFLEVVKNTPLISIDLIVSNPAGEVLLGHRLNKPARHTWFVPGGKIIKDELLGQAFQRIAHDELGLNLHITILPGGAPRLDQSDPIVRDITFKGIYEHLYPDNFADAEGISTHYIVLAYRIELAQPLVNLPPDQHSDYKWWKVEELLKTENVHANSKAYFQ
jgi:colanic acid biosynthesis protein WcaH